MARFSPSLTHISLPTDFRTAYGSRIEGFRKLNPPGFEGVDTMNKPSPAELWPTLAPDWMLNAPEWLGDLFIALISVLSMATGT